MTENRGSRGDNRRIPRVEREIREVIGIYLLGSFRGELPGIVSVTRVIASKDLRNAKVLISMMGFGDEDEAKTKASRKAAILELKAYAHEIQHEVNKKLRMKFCPRLTFFYDDGYENAMKVENILRDLGSQRVKAEASDSSPNDLADDQADDETED